MINPGVVLHSIPELLDLADRYDQIYTAVGLHPHDAKDWNDDSFDIIYKACRHPKVVAIGECGLDFFYNNSDHDSQVKCLKAQIKIALETDKPIIIHCRDAWDEIMTLLEEEGKGEIRGVFHCFTGGPELLPRIEKLDFYVSFSASSHFPNRSLFKKQQSWCGKTACWLRLIVLSWHHRRCAAKKTNRPMSGIRPRNLQSCATLHSVPSPASVETMLVRFSICR